jgi:hypothetical protein
MAQWLAVSSHQCHHFPAQWSPINPPLSRAASPPLFTWRHLRRDARPSEIPHRRRRWPTRNFPFRHSPFRLPSFAANDEVGGGARVENFNCRRRANSMREAMNPGGVFGWPRVWPWPYQEIIGLAGRSLGAGRGGVAKCGRPFPTSVAGRHLC